MKKLHIAIKNKNKLTSYLDKNYETSYYEKPTFLKKLFSKPVQNPDIYLHQGSLNTEAKELIVKSTLTVVNTSGMKNKITDTLADIDPKSIQIVYPYVTNKIEYDENIKAQFREKYNLDQNTRIIYFSSKDFIHGGLKSFLKLVSQMEEKNFKILIDGDKKQIDQLKMMVNRLKVNFQIIMIEDHPNKDELFIASDIFILPTKQKNYTPSILKAMYFKNAVFIPDTNYTSEIVDTFAIMNSTEDPSIPFKIDALLSNPGELEQIQNINENMAKSFSFESRSNIINSIIDSLSEKD